MKCDNQAKNLERCNCSSACSLKGICCECIANHRKKNQLPACYFDDQAEKTYDRSIEHYMRLNR